MVEFQDEEPTYDLMSAQDRRIARRTPEERIGAAAERRWERLRGRRYNALLREGFTPEEALTMTTVKISGGRVRNLRRRRLRRVMRYARRMGSMTDAIDIVRQEVIEAGQEFLTFDEFLTAIYS